MQSVSESFSWLVQPGAYRCGPWTVPDWDEEEPRPIGLMSGSLTPGRLKPVRRYTPLRDHSGLFRIFAKTEPHQEGILKFAERFGMLIWADLLPEQARTRDQRRGRSVSDSLAAHFEPYYELWHREIMTMRQAIAVWQWLESDDRHELERLIRWHDDATGICTVEFDTHPDLPLDASPRHPELRLHAVVASRDDGSGWLGHLTPGDPRFPARLWLQGLINGKLKDQLMTRFSLDASGVDGG